jgi:transcriptional regulator with XRE-family HTH domain
MTPILRHQLPTVSQELDAAGVAFGQNLRRWRLRNGWSQNTAQDWAQSIGVPAVFNSQWSQLETARLRGPKPLLFRALGILNSLLAAQEYGSFTDRALMDRVKQAEPICHPDGKPWTGPDFYAAFMGQLAWPEMPDPLPEISDAEAQEISSQFRQLVRAAGGVDGADIGMVLSTVIGLAPPEAQARTAEVLMGGSWTGAELMALRTSDGELLPMAWVAQLAESAKR